MRAVTVILTDAEDDALDRFLTAHPVDLTRAEGAHLLLREALIGLGDMDSELARAVARVPTAT